MASPRLPLRQRLTLSLLSVGLASLVLAGVVYISFDLVSRRALIEERLDILGRQIASARAEKGFPEGLPSDGSWADVLARDRSVLSASLQDADGNLLAWYESPDVASPGNGPGGEPSSILSPFVSRTIRIDGVRVGTISLEGNSKILWEHLGNHAAIFLVLLGVSVLLTMGLARRVHHKFSDQILDLAHAANAISARKDYSIRALRRSDDEVGILVDTFNHMITQIELRDLQLKSEVKRAQAAKIAKAQFLATMSHEIRTPINGILGMTELMLDTSLSKEQREFAVTIRKSADNLLAIINDILDFSKGEAGRYEVERIPFSMTDLIDESIDTVSIVACERGLELCCQVDTAVPINLRGDPARLRQVLLNLLSNAVKFTKEGEIVVRVSMEKDHGDEVEVRFEVQDSGIGIPKDRLDRLFKSFSQVDASNNRKYGGTGLGLAICKQIIEAMGGTLFVNTQEGVGSTFGFRICFEKEHSVELEIGPPAGLTILVADPNEASRESLAHMLGEDNQLELAVSGTHASEILLQSERTKKRLDLLLMDIRLAKSFMQSLADVPGWQPIPLVLLAPVNQLSSASAFEWEGKRACVAKPLKRRDLFWCLSEIRFGDFGEEALDDDSPLLPEKSSAFEAFAQDTEQEDYAEEPAEPFEGVRVLVAEDHPVNQKITTRYLDKLGIQWELAENGEEAVKLVRDERFDLVLMDVQMPVMDGLEATFTIRKLEETSGVHVPIIAMTAAVLDEDRRQCQEAGCDDYLPKPVKLDELRDNISKWVTEKRKEVA